MNKNITAIVPVLNEEKNIEKVLLDLNKFCKNIIVINDGSTDNTSEILEKISKYLSYSQEQESNLSSLETQKEEFKNTYFNLKGNKGNISLS